MCAINTSIRVDEQLELGTLFSVHRSSSITKVMVMVKSNKKKGNISRRFYMLSGCIPWNLAKKDKATSRSTLCIKVKLQKKNFYQFSSFCILCVVRMVYP